MAEISGAEHNLIVHLSELYDKLRDHPHPNRDEAIGEEGEDGWRCRFIEASLIYMNVTLTPISRRDILGVLTHEQK